MPKAFYKVTQGTVPIEQFVFGHGTRILHGTADPTDGVTGRGRAATGSLYIKTHPSASAIYENTGSKQLPSWTVRVS
jgi:hypothetical protein